MTTTSPTTDIIRTAAHRSGMNDSELARRTGTPRQTMSDCLKHPGSIRLYQLRAIVEETMMTDAEIVKLVRAN